MNRQIKILSFVLSLLTLASLFSFAGAAKEEGAFAGTRTVIFHTDPSDLENYFEGGRAGLDLRLRANSPDFLEYRLHALPHQRVVELVLSFSFSGFDEYRQRLKFLLGSEPSLLYSASPKPVLLEGDSVRGWLDFLQESGDAAAIPLDEIFSVSANRIEVNGRTVESESDLLTLSDETEEPVFLSSLSIETAGDENGVFTRTLTARARDGEDEEDLKARFKRIGKLTEEDGAVSVRFSAYTLKEIASKTYFCLKGATDITEDETPENKKEAAVLQKEYFDLSSLLADGADFSYRFALPSCFKEVEIQDAPEEFSFVTDEAGVSTSFRYDAKNPALSRFSLALSYRRGIRFDSIEVKTDLTDGFGRITREILFTISDSIPEKTHEFFVQEFSGRAPRGSTLLIQKEGRNYLYRFTFSSFFAGEVKEFTEAVLNASAECGRESGVFFYGTDMWFDDLSFKKVISGMAPTGNVRQIYRLPNAKSAVTEEDFDRDDEGDLVFQGVKKSGIRLEYSRLRLVQLIGFLLCLVLILAVFRILIQKGIKPILARRKEQTAETKKAKRAESAPPLLCPACRAQNKPGARFCEACGAKIEPK